MENSTSFAVLKVGFSVGNCSYPANVGNFSMSTLIRSLINTAQAADIEEQVTIIETADGEEKM